MVARRLYRLTPQAKALRSRFQARTVIDSELVGRKGGRN